MKNQIDLEKMRHSSAHILAAAVRELYPGVKLGIGPVIENGFYYDFDFPNKFSLEDLPKIEKKMSELIKKDLKFECLSFSLSDALALLKKQDQPYKIELVKDLEKEGHKEVTFYKSGDFIDLCAGPHVKSSKQIGSFKLLNIAGAYWRGSEKNTMMQRIYGTACITQEELDNHLKRLEEAKERDHRKIGKDLNLFIFSDLVGAGLPLLTAKGATIKRELERMVIEEETKRGYQHVSTPPLAKVDLYRTSGHYPYYKEVMYPPLKVDDEELILRPMTCPHHFMLYKSQIRSYRELPLKIAEISEQFRYEKSGELSGLMRVRTFTLTDAHIFCTPEQASSVVSEVLDLIDYFSEIFGLEKGIDYQYRLSLGERNEEKKYYKDDQAWDKAEETLREVLVKNKAPFYEAKGEAAFYGPKIDIQMKNLIGKEETAFTVQYDFVQPKRFDLKYIAVDGKEKEPVVIHRSSIGAIERTMAFLIERDRGVFPVWLSPIQAILIPISDRHIEYCQRLNDTFLERGVRVELDNREETMQAKIRDAQLQKIPYMLIVGDKEVAQKGVAVRTREGKDLGLLKVGEFEKRVLGEIAQRK